MVLLFSLFYYELYDFNVIILVFDRDSIRFLSSCHLYGDRYPYFISVYFDVGVSCTKTALSGHFPFAYWILCFDALFFCFHSISTCITGGDCVSDVCAQQFFLRSDTATVIHFNFFITLN